MDAGECHFDSGTVGIRVADGSAVPSARRRIRTAVPGPAVAGSAETGAVGHFFRRNLLTCDPGCSAIACNLH